MAITKETWDLLLNAIATGLTNKDACNAVGISEESLYKRTRKPKEDCTPDEIEFVESLKKAQIKFKLQHLQNISKAGSKHWQASAWILERKFKREFGRLEISTTIDKDDIESEEALLKELQELEKQENEYRNRKEKANDTQKTAES